MDALLVGVDAQLGVPQSVGVLIAEGGTVSVYYNDGIVKDWAFNAAGSGWIDITPSGVPAMPAGGNNVGVQAIDDNASNDTFFVDFVGLIENHDTVPAPPAEGVGFARLKTVCQPTHG